MAHNDDGKAHFTYFDKDTQLSFVWDGDRAGHVEVSHGGYGEPMIGYIDLLDSAVPVIDGAADWLAWFADECKEFVKDHASTLLPLIGAEVSDAQVP